MTDIYDPASQVTNLLHKIVSGGAQINKADYVYNDVGNRTSLTDKRGVQSFGYDALNRLTSATHPLTFDQTFSYDPVGNRTTNGSLYNAGNQLTEDANFTYTYDLNGNLTRKTFKTSGNHTDYTYDAENRLIRVDEFAAGSSTPGATSTYRYDGLGRRIEKVGNGQTRRYIYDREDILLEYDGANVLQARYTHGPGIDEPIAMQRGGVNYFYHADGLGTVTELTDSTGTTAQAYAYDAWGNIIQQTGSVENPYTYTGREFDSETGLYYYRARYYDPRTGRFLQKDRMGLESPEAPFTLYSYVASNPTNLTDPSGLITYKSGVPPASPALASLLGCMESCYGQPLVITSTTDSHPGDNPHSRGEAADIRYPSDPKKLLCCSAQCGAGYAKDGKIHPSSKSTAPHIHVQTGAGTGGGAGDLPTSPPCGCNTP